MRRGRAQRPDEVVVRRRLARSVGAALLTSWKPGQLPIQSLQYRESGRTVHRSSSPDACELVSRRHRRSLAENRRRGYETKSLQMDLRGQAWVGGQGYRTVDASRFASRMGRISLAPVTRSPSTVEPVLHSRGPRKNPSGIRAGARVRSFRMSGTAGSTYASRLRIGRLHTIAQAKA
jgi:hypothetical protein